MNKKGNNHCDWKEIAPGIWDLECKPSKIPIDKVTIESIKKATKEIEDSDSRKVVLHALNSVGQ